MPILPIVGTTSTIGQINSSTINGSMGSLPLTRRPSSGSQPNLTPATGVTGISTEVAIPDKNIEMKDSTQEGGCYGYIDFSLHFLLLPFLLSFYHLLISLKSKSPFSISTIHFPQSWNLFY